MRRSAFSRMGILNHWLKKHSLKPDKKTWWFQPICKICESNWMIIPPGRGEHIFFGNHHPENKLEHITFQQKTFTDSPGKFHLKNLFWLPDIQPKMMVDVFPAGDMLVELGPRPSENGFMEPKYLAEEVIIHPNHHLTRWLHPYKGGLGVFVPCWVSQTNIQQALSWTCAMP